MHYQQGSCFFSFFNVPIFFQEFVIIYVNVKFNLNNINIMDMKRHMLICLFISKLMGKKKE
jgi:hypothetical protein